MDPVNRVNAVDGFSEFFQRMISIDAFNGWQYQLGIRCLVQLLDASFEYSGFLSVHLVQLRNFEILDSVLAAAERCQQTPNCRNIIAVIPFEKFLERPSWVGSVVIRRAIDKDACGSGRIAVDGSGRMADVAQPNRPV